MRKGRTTTMTNYTATNANLNSADYRTTHKPQPTICQICHQAPAVRCVTHHDERDDSYWSAYVCGYCASKVGK